MSVQLSMWDSGAGNPENRVGADEFRARLGREMAYLLTISTNAGRVGQVTPSGVASSLSVCLIEDWHMSRGKVKGGNRESAATMPRFVDVRLTAEQRIEFGRFELLHDDGVRALQSLADDGYRVGVTWSGEQQAYTVSLTCRNAESPNNGLCMTSFAKTLRDAIRLTVFKHVVVTDEKWLEATFGSDEEFG